MRKPKPVSVGKAALLTAVLSGCTNPGYNDNPSQQITTARVGCPASTGFFTVYFSVRVQPAVLPEDAIAQKNIYRSYCHDIPVAGKVFLTADLVDNQSSTTPIALRIVERSSNDDDEEDEAQTIEERPVLAEWPAEIYSKGVIETSFDLPTNGRYALELIRGENGARQVGEMLNIPLNIGVDPERKYWMLRAQALGGNFVIFGLIGYAIFRFLTRKKEEDQ